MNNTMRAWPGGHRAGRWAITAAILGAAVVIGGCSSTNDNLLGSSAGKTAATPGAGGFGQSFSQTTGQDSTPGTTPQGEIDCPRVTIREGASTYSVGTGNDTSALALRYQGTFGQMARECALLGATMTIRVGVQGRVILGPAGGPGQIELPLRYALVQEGPEPKTIWTKFYKVPVIIPEASSNVVFTHVEQDMTFPYPAKASEFDAYIIYVGFDPLGKTDTPKKPAKKPGKPPAKPQRRP